VLTPLLELDASHALIGFPSHPNVGDCALWLGTVKLLETLGINIVYVCDTLSFSERQLRERVGGGTILLHGGGNFGDLWPRHHRLREQVVEAFPENRIVQLPQSIHFDSSATLARARRTINAHPDITILARDRNSLSFSEGHFEAPAQLCPDLAFGLGPLGASREPSTPILWLRRTDKEASSTASPATEVDVRAVDWMGYDDARPAERLYRILRKGSGTWARGVAREPPGYRLLQTPLWLLFGVMARMRLASGQSLLQQGEVVVTDRLHGHILCLLMGIPHVVLDNTYGKLRGFHETWTAESDLVHWAETGTTALELARTLGRTRI